MTVDELAGYVRTLWQAAAVADRLPANIDSVRTLWLLGAHADAGRIHGLIGDHTPADCPVCTPEAQVATSGDAASVAAPIVTGNLASAGVTRGQLASTFQQLLSEAQAAIPFFEQYARDPAVPSQQWTDFQAIPLTTTDGTISLYRIVYDLVRMNATLLRYLTGYLPTA